MNSEITSFKKIYISFLSILSLACILFISFILLIDVIPNKVIINVSMVFVISIFIIGLAFVYFLRKKILNIFNILDKMINKAINEEEMNMEYDETLLSSLESKMYRYIKITKGNKQIVEEERNKVKALVSDISHQTKTPISNILLYSQLVLENENIDNYTKDILNDIKKQSERLNFLIQSLIKMSRLENKIIKPSIEKNKIIDVISKSVQEIFINAQQKEIDISVNCDKALLASIDSKWTREAVVNILENAIKYTHEGGYIDIDVTSYELFRRIDIKDNGIGIDEDEINNIFKRFYRSKNTKNFEGVGIGLFLAREIISIQGGYIKVTSQIGKGSTFSIFVPS